MSNTIASSSMILAHGLFDRDNSIIQRQPDLNLWNENVLKESDEIVSGRKNYSVVWPMGSLLLIRLLLEHHDSANSNSKYIENFSSYIKPRSIHEKAVYPQGSFRLVLSRIDSKPMALMRTPETTDAASAELETIFSGLARIWRESTGGLASTSRRFMHPTYMAILRLGPETVPLILKELQRKPDWWFDALERLTKANPLPTKPTDTFEEAVKAWIKWGQTKNLIR